MRFTQLSIFLMGLGFSMSSYAIDLMAVYEQAQSFDPQLQKAVATRMSIRENKPLSESALLPSIGAQASTAEYHSHNSLPISENNPVKNYTYGVTTYSLSISQPLFNFASWMNLRQVDARLKQADASYGVALQELILRTAKAYFSVLQSEDVLRITQAQKKLLARQSNEAKQRFEVGFNTITDVYNAQASYDKVVAQEINDQNDVNNQYEALRMITGKRYSELALLNKKIPLISPNPANIDQWVKAAEAQNLQLIAAKFSQEAMREAIKVKAAGHLPTVDASGTYARSNGGSSATYIPGVVEGTSLGLTLKVPLYQGGAVNAQTRQAQYDYQAAVSDMEITHQSVLSNTRQYYANVLADIQRLKADRVFVKSARSAYESNLAAYQVGTKTNIDVLSAQKDLFDAQRKYSTDQYTYIMNTLVLKQIAGTLNPMDLKMINSWLKTMDEKMATQHIEKEIGIQSMKVLKKKNPRGNQ
ncbi:MAG: Outer membrane protein TolC [Legionellaceae bacterium]